MPTARGRGLARTFARLLLPFVTAAACAPSCAESKPAPAPAGDAGVSPFDAASDAGGSFAGIPGLSIEDYPRVDGSTSTLPLARVIACDLLGVPYRWQQGIGEGGAAEIVPVAENPDEQPLAAAILEHVVHNKTHQAYLNLVDAKADLILVANLPSDDERAYASTAGVTLVTRPVALDALVILDNAANGVENLTADQVRWIFSGRVTRWSDVGGSAEPIDPYVRPPDSGSQQLMETVVMQGVPMGSWPEDVIETMDGLVDRIQSDPLSIGYSVYYYVTYQYPGPNYRVLSVDGTTPTADTIARRTYPFAAEVWVVIRENLDPQSLARRLFEWLLSPEGQRTVGHSGYVPVRR